MPTVKLKALAQLAKLQNRDRSYLLNEAVDHYLALHQDHLGGNANMPVPNPALHLGQVMFDTEKQELVLISLIEEKQMSSEGKWERCDPYPVSAIALHTTVKAGGEVVQVWENRPVDPDKLVPSDFDNALFRAARRWVLQQNKHGELDA